MLVSARTHGALQSLSAQLCRVRQDTRTDVGPYFSDLRCIVIGQHAMGRSLVDQSIAVVTCGFAVVPFAKLQYSFYS